MYIHLITKCLEEETIFSTKKRYGDDNYVRLVAAIMGIHLFLTNIILLNLLSAIFK